MTQLESIEEKIGGHKFEVFKLDPLTSLAAINLVKDTLAPSLGTVLGAVDSIKDIAQLLDSKASAGKLGGAVEQLLMGATVERQKSMIETFMPVTTVDGKKLTQSEFDLLFRGDLPLMFAWLKLCFRGEWGNLGGAIKDAMSDAIARGSSLLKSQDISPTGGPSSS